MDSSKGNEVMIVDYYNGTEVIVVDFIPHPASLRGEGEITTDGNQSQLSSAVVEGTRLKNHETKIAIWHEQVSSLHTKLDNLINLFSSQDQQKLKDQKENGVRTKESRARSGIVELQVHQNLVEETSKQSENKVFEEMSESENLMVEGNDPLTGHMISTTIEGENGQPKHTISYMAEQVVCETNISYIDSPGCVIEELLLGYPLFPRENAVDQLVETIKVLGTPTREEIRCMNPHSADFRYPQIKTHPWHKVFHKWMSPKANDLAFGPLPYSPNLRCKLKIYMEVEVASSFANSDENTRYFENEIHIVQSMVEKSRQNVAPIFLYGILLMDLNVLQWNILEIMISNLEFSSQMFDPGIKKMLRFSFPNSLQLFDCKSIKIENRWGNLEVIASGILHGGSLEKALRKFFQPEVLDRDNEYMIDNFKELVAVSKKMFILEAPNVLVVQLKRFEGIFGFSPEYGHCYAYKEGELGCWYCCNDWRSKSRDQELQYIFLKWLFAILVELLSGVIATFINPAVENILGYMAMHGWILSESKASSELRQASKDKIQKVGTTGAKVLLLEDKLEKMEILPDGNLLQEVHVVAEDLQILIYQKSYCLVHAEGWDAEKQAENDVDPEEINKMNNLKSTQSTIKNPSMIGSMSRLGEHYTEYIVSKIKSLTSMDLELVQQATKACWRGNLSKVSHDNSGYYLILKGCFMVENVRKAILIHEHVLDSLTISMVDNVLFVLQICCKEISFSNRSSFIAVFSNVTILLGSELDKALQQDMWEINLGDKLLFGGVRVHKTDMEIATSLKILDITREYALKLQHEIEE